MSAPSLWRVAARRAVRQMSYVLVGLLGLGHRLFTSRRQTTARVHRILVIRLDLLGDVLFSTQAVESLRTAYPDARIVILTLPYTASIATLHPGVDAVMSVDTNRIRTPRGLLNPETWREYRRIVRQLREERFDLAISLSGRMASLWALLSGAPRRIGYSGEQFPNMLSDLVPGGRYQQPVHEVEYVRRLAARAGGGAAGPHLSVSVQTAARSSVARLLSSHGLEAGNQIVVVHAGSINGSAKRWPPAYWAKFSDQIQSRTGARVVLVGAGSDELIARRVQERARTPLISLVGLTSVEELIALLARADLIATGDSGPLHIAVALGRPLVAVYGPTDPRIHGPFNPQGPVALHRKDLACSPCYTMANTAECPLGDPICMRLVPVDEMVASAIRLLEDTGTESA